MKRILIIFMVTVMTVTMAFSLTACKKSQKVVKDGAKIIVGVTDYAPMDYLDENGKWIGFDAELAQIVFGNLGYTVEFKEIDWDTKIVALKSGKIDAIWNGMTVTDELLSNLLLTNAYLKNTQIAVVKSENVQEFSSKNSLVGKKVAVESGSAAQDLMEKENISCELRKVTNQNSAVMEVFAGTSDVAIVDLLLAREICTSDDYKDKLTYVNVGLSNDEYEEFSVAFRKSDSKLFYNVNKELDKLKKDGALKALAQKYGIEDALI